MSISNWDTNKNNIHYRVVCLMHVTYIFFPFTCLPIFFKEDEKKDDFFSKVFFLARYLIDFKVNYMKEILSGLAGF